MPREIRRQIFHMFWGVTFAVLMFLEIIDWKILLGLTIFGIILTLYIKWVGEHVPGIHHLIKYMGRPEEIPGWGALTTVIGATLAAMLFPTDIAAASVMILGIGDSISHMGGRFLGKTKSFLSKRKKLEGFIIGFITSFLAALFMVPNTLALTGAFFAMLVEHSDLTDFVDDNILVPLTAGIAMTVLQAVIIL